MTLKDPLPIRCLNPCCPNTVQQVKKSGRPRQYCSEACGKAYRKNREVRSARVGVDQAAYTREVADDLARQIATCLEAARTRDPLTALRQVVQVEKDFADLKDALVQQARHQGTKSAQIAEAMRISPYKLSRDMSAIAVSRRRENRRRARSSEAAAPLADRPAPPSASSQGPALRLPGGRSSPPTSADPSPVSSDASTSAGGAKPMATLARALTHLQRTSDKTLRALAGESGVSASYVSRILSGGRCPSWKITRQIALSCDADPAALKPLWDIARGHTVAQADTFHAALRGLHLAASCPEPETIRQLSQSALTVNDITMMLHGQQVPAWQIVDHFISALHGRPETIRPLWDAARHAALAAQPAEAPVSARVESLSEAL
ncbi:helix-turn-helix transcriptional regulator [Streptomyces sp. ME19-01-6]|uniref:helix-turn-helix domain-containing protein n=1 Tax=Streptomyces sp. ME19-01-6 TaxID=3028686 RepID=UPI0029BC45EB|nr:helix-turn-helix transcriptional regulator [Streptomyces sp. ME19-01-6]MDX3229236.1 helix-turn-helix transcriptional regulator [Streptomyces sp. ME19-01-6]